jgi:hypothetical protein
MAFIMNSKLIRQLILQAVQYFKLHVQRHLDLTENALWTKNDLKLLDEIVASLRTHSGDDTMSVSPIFCNPTAWVSACCKDQQCALCGQPASAKVAEEIFFDDPYLIRHALSAYVCASHFLQIMGPAGLTSVEEFRSKQCPLSEGEGSREPE